MTLPIFSCARFVELSHPLKCPLPVKCQPTRPNPSIRILIQKVSRTQHMHLNFHACKNWTFSVHCSRHRIRVSTLIHRPIYGRTFLWQGQASLNLQPARKQSTDNHPSHQVIRNLLSVSPESKRDCYSSHSSSYRSANLGY